MARTKGSDSKLTELRIRKVALNLFSQYGYAAVSMRRIASKVDLQVGTLYLYTPNKQALLFDLLKESWWQSFLQRYFRLNKIVLLMVTYLLL